MMLTIASDSRYGGARRGCSPRPRDHFGLVRCLISHPRACRLFALLCQTSEPEGGGQYRGVRCPQTSASTSFLPDPDAQITPFFGQVLLIKVYTGVPARVSGAAWARGGGGLEGDSGAQGGDSSTLHPLDPWKMLQINFWEFSGLVALGLPTRAATPRK